MPSREANYNARGVFIIMRLPVIIVYIWNLVIIISESFIGELVLYIVIIRKCITTVVQYIVLSICPPWRRTSECWTRQITYENENLP